MIAEDSSYLSMDSSSSKTYARGQNNTESHGHARCGIGHVVMNKCSSEERQVLQKLLMDVMDIVTASDRFATV